MRFSAKSLVLLFAFKKTHLNQIKKKKKSSKGYNRKFHSIQALEMTCPFSPFIFWLLSAETWRDECVNVDNNEKGVEKAQVSVKFELRLFSHREWIVQGMGLPPRQATVLYSTHSVLCSPLNMSSGSFHAFPQKIMLVESREYLWGSCQGSYGDLCISPSQTNQSLIFYCVTYSCLF